MAKNVFFDGTDYLVDDSLLATVKDALKTHFSSTLAGSGAVINFGGVNYNIDSTKLGTARTDLVNHLGTISGSGRKVKVGSVEYGIDAGKMSAAKSELSRVLNDLELGNSEKSVMIVTEDGYIVTDKNENILTIKED
jgi:hypothetical protein